MVIRIRTGKTIQGALNYNERKVRQQKAELICASGFGCLPTEMNFYEKLNRFRQLQQLNDYVNTNTLHISLNFPPEEVISNDKMNLIASEYMERIGFLAQPYLVYRHNDARHPHIHIITTNIQPNSKAIRLHNIAKRLSEPARKTIEQMYGLIPAESRKPRYVHVSTATDLLPAKYGREETKSAITNIVGEVVRTYKFTSLEEFNVILRQMNIVAYRGRAGSRIHQKQGLVYSLLDNEGFRIGVPIKASSIYAPALPASNNASTLRNAPTLAYLERKFSINAVKKAASKVYTARMATHALNRSVNGEDFSEKLKEKGIILHYVQNHAGILHDLYLVDHRNRATYTYRELNLSLDRINSLRIASESNNQNMSTSSGDHASKSQIPAPASTSEASLLSGLVLELFRSQHVTYYGSPEEVPKRRRRKKNRPSI